MEFSKKIEESFTKIEKLFSSKELLKFKKTAVDDLTVYHFGLGIWIRKNLLNEKCDLYNSFIKQGTTNKDDMSLLIIQKYHEYLLFKTNFPHINMDSV